MRTWITKHKNILILICVLIVLALAFFLASTKDSPVGDSGSSSVEDAILMPSDAPSESSGDDEDESNTSEFTAAMNEAINNIESTETNNANDAAPTETPRPTISPAPVNTPNPTETPEPEHTLEPTSTPEPSEEETNVPTPRATEAPALVTQITDDQGREIDVFDQRNEAVRYFVEDVHYSFDDYTVSRSKEVISKFSATCAYNRPVGYAVYLPKPGFLTVTSEEGSKAPFIEHISRAGEYRIYNLIPNVVYKWEFIADGESDVSQSGYIKATGNVRMINTQGLANARDLGGWDADGGTVKYGMLFRGGPMTGSIILSNTDVKIVWKLGVKCEVDLRTYAEVSGADGIFGTKDDETYCPVEGVEYILSPIGGYAPGVTIGTHSADVIIDTLRIIMDHVVDGKPVYFHCAAGADRTGTIAFLLEGILGVPMDQIDKDYELTGFGFRGGFRFRNSNEYRGMVDYILRLDGETTQDKFITWFKLAGFTTDEINAFREAMIDGSPTKVS